MSFNIVDNLKTNLNLKINYGGLFLDKHITTSFNILHLNIQSLRNKLTKFSNFVDFSKTIYHVIVLSETHIKANESQFFDLPGYKAAHCTREGRLSGGVSIFVRKDFSDFNIIHSIDFDLNSSLLIELTCNNVKILGFYKYRDCNFNKFTNHLTKTLENSPQCIVVGDFNIDLFKIDSNNFCKDYHDLIISSGFIFLNPLSEATRVDITRGSSTLIDHCFSDIPLLNPLYEFSFYLDDLFGDHKAFLVAINMTGFKLTPPSRTIKIITTHHSSIQKDKAIENIQPTDFTSFQNSLCNVIENYTSITVKKERFRKPFMNIEILTTLKIRDNYHRLMKRFPWSLKATSRYKQFRNEATAKIRSAKIAFYDKRFHDTSDNPKKFWRNVNNLLTNSDGKHESACRSLLINGKETSNRVAIANEFNLHFTTIAHHIKRSITINPLHYELLHEQEVYYVFQPLHNDDLYTSELEVSLTIGRLKNSHSRDANNFTNNLFKTHKNSLAFPISTLINKSLSEGTFPDCLKLAKISPLFKQNGNAKDPNNYRGLAENSLLGKCYEDIILDRLSTHLIKNKIIDNNQFGFTKGSSTEVATIHLLSKVYNNINDGKETSIIFIDLAKAFDCVDHSLLLDKLKKLSLPSLLLDVLESYLKDRKQFVLIEDIKSSILPVTTGVFQGSKIAACLFIFYINSIFTLPLKGTLVLYADDIALIYGEKDPIILKKSMEDDLILLNCWVQNHFMQINIRKTNYIYFTGHARNDSFISNGININLNGTQITRVEAFDYLGLLIDEKLSFKQHINSIRSRILATSFAIKRIRPFITLHTAKQIYFNRIHSLLIYLNSCWNTANKTEIDNLARTQRKVLRFVFEKPYDSPSRDLFSNKILPLSHLNTFQNCLLTFKLARGLLRSNIQILLRRDITNRETKQSNDFYIPFSKSWAGRSDFFKRGLDTFNKLPKELKNIRTVGKFKEDLKEYLYMDCLRNGFS
jgi:hypothetical protein